MSVAFDHLALGTPESAWRADPRLITRGGRDLAARWSALTTDVSVLVIAAHPDDESLGAGGLMAMAAARGARVHVIVATNGDASHPSSPTHTATELAEIRRREVRAAVAELDPSAQVTLLNRPDGRLNEHESELAEVIASHLTDGTLLVTPWIGDQHPDHEACARAGADAIGRFESAAIGRAEAAAIGRGATAATHWQYPVWLWHWAAPDGPAVPWSTMGFLDLDEAAQSAKARAVSRHLSQHDPLSDQPGDEAILPPRLLKHFARPFETFVIAAEAGDQP